MLNLGNDDFSSNEEETNEVCIPVSVKPTHNSEIIEKTEHNLLDDSFDDLFSSEDEQKEESADSKTEKKESTTEEQQLQINQSDSTVNSNDSALSNVKQAYISGLTSSNSKNLTESDSDVEKNEELIVEVSQEESTVSTKEEHINQFQTRIKSRYYLDCNGKLSLYPTEEFKYMAEDYVELNSILKTENSHHIKYNIENEKKETESINSEVLLNRIAESLFDLLVKFSNEAVIHGKPLDIAKQIISCDNPIASGFLCKAYADTLNKIKLSNDDVDDKQLETYIKERTQKVRAAVLSKEFEKTGQNIDEEVVKQYLNSKNTKETKALIEKELKQIPEEIKFPNKEKKPIFPITMGVRRNFDEDTEEFSNITFNLTTKDGTNLSFTLNEDISVIDIMESIRVAGLFNTLKIHQGELESLKLKDNDITHKFKPENTIEGLSKSEDLKGLNGFSELINTFKFSDLVASDAEKYNDYAISKASNYQEEEEKEEQREPVFNSDSNDSSTYNSEQSNSVTTSNFASMVKVRKSDCSFSTQSI